MRIESISNVNFKSVYAISGSKEQAANLYNNLQQKRAEEKALMLPATDIYEGSQGRGFCATSVRDGKQVAFLITGKNIKDVLFMNPGWGSMNGISHHIADCYEIKDDKEAANHFENIIEKDWEEDSKQQNKSEN